MTMNNIKEEIMVIDYAIKTIKSQKEDALSLLTISLLNDYREVLLHLSKNIKDSIGSGGC